MRKHEMLTIRTLQRRVNRGFKLLVSKTSLDKVLNINLYRLDLTDQDNCPVGQTLGDYYDETKKLFGVDNVSINNMKDIGLRKAIQHGFTLEWKNPGWDDTDKDNLTEAWRDKIEVERKRKIYRDKRARKLTAKKSELSVDTLFATKFEKQDVILLKIGAHILNNPSVDFVSNTNCYIIRAVKEQFGNVDAHCNPNDIHINQTKYDILGGNGYCEVLRKWKEMQNFPHNGFLTVILERVGK